MLKITNKLLFLSVLIVLGLGQLNITEADKIKSDFENGIITLEEATGLAKKLAIPRQTNEKLTDTLNVVEHSDLDSINNYQLATPEPLIILEEESMKNTEEKNYFGYNFFNNSPTSFHLDQIGPVDPNYRIGPGDEIKIHMWGESEYYHSKTVSRDGAIYIEKIGQIIVNGLTLDGLNKKLLDALSKVYYTLKPHKNEKATTFLFVTLGSLKSITIYFLGEMKRIGAFKVDSYSTAFTALYFAGGPTVNGSLRNIQIIRDGKRISTLDLYEYLTTGMNLDDIRIQHGDHIFIPQRGKTVTVNGEVEKPFIFELLPNETLPDLVKYAGGLTVKADINRVQIHRIRGYSERVTLSDTAANIILIDEILTKRNRNNEVIIDEHPLKDGDKIKIFKIAGEQKGFVSIKGAVYRPGIFALNKNKTFDELIKNCEGFLPDVHLGKADLIRTLPNDSTIFIELSLDEILINNIELQDKDELFIYSIWDLKHKPFVEIKGNIKSPGIYKLHQGMTLYNLLYKSTYFDDDEFLKTIKDEIEIIRIDKDYKKSIKFVLSFKKIISGKDNIKLQDKDIVLIKKSTKLKQNFIDIHGEIKYPGTYYYKDGTTLKSIIQTAGGLTENSFLFGAKYFSDSVKVAIDFKKFDINKYDITLGTNDFLTIPVKPNNVKIIGHVRNSNVSISYLPNWNVDDYIETTGGLLDNADYSSLYVIYPDGTSKNRKWVFNPEVTKGSVIIVPEKIKEEDLGIREFIKEMTAILSNLATIILILTK